ncbi:hypothetical protein NQ317_011864 [Molorchus minor]|uniref:BZIP domain-containing protein n=1 Tax=Molorchus minor TaxID=1323400 RepID=A0ABQ9IZG9_9CUCU|nr:hypothetical protein NQ317_011864 [Molorchus minor]
MTYIPRMTMYHSPPASVDPPVLDLSTRRKTISANYPYDYSGPQISPSPIVEPLQLSSPNSRSSTSESPEVSSSEYAKCTPKLKATRPFKAYPKDPLSVALVGTTVEALGKDSVHAYTEFRDKVLSAVQATHCPSNKNMRRNQCQNTQIDDPTYWEKRKKNNEAAKRSRDARRAKEDEITIRCAFLEQENMQLKFRVATLEEENKKLQQIIYR